MNLIIVRTSACEPVSTASPARPQPACAGVDPELFFAHALAVDEIDTAKAVCESCPLKASCLQGALERGEQYGVWGGTDEGERRSIMRRSARKRGAA